MSGAKLLWRLANLSTLKTLRGESGGQYDIRLGRTEPIAGFFSGLPQVKDHEGTLVGVWTEPAPHATGDGEFPPWLLKVRRMSGDSARPNESYIRAQRPGTAHPLWRPGTGPIASTDPDTDYIVLLRIPDDRFFAAWLREGQLADLPAALRERVEATQIGVQAPDDGDLEALLPLFGQPADLKTLQLPAEEPNDVFDGVVPENEPPIAHEGQPVKVQHVRRERSRRLRRERVEAAGERPKCEACGFDFEQIYGGRGRGFVECHHLIPLSELDPATPTRLEDLALLCANCHRMIHINPLLDIDELRELLAATAKK